MTARSRTCTLPYVAGLLALSVFVANGDQALAQEATGLQSEAAAAEEEAASPVSQWQAEVDHFFGTYLVEPLATVLFYDFGTKQWLGTSLPFVVMWLMVGAIYLTLRMGFINFRAFWHAIRVTKGDYDDPKDEGEVSHFQALASALSATVGLGNIGGVAIAVGTGGPGAVFWMIIAGLIGMTSKFTECTLAQVYRRVDAEGRVSGGPMRYLRDGLTRMGLGPLGAVLSIMFTILCIGASLGGGCAFQVNQSMGIVSSQIPQMEQHRWVYGLVMAFLVGIVIIGGIRRIASTAEKIVPAMCLIYVLGALVVLIGDYQLIPWAFGEIFRQAFDNDSIYGGILGVMVIGSRRAAFSNEAGVGSAAIAHSAARTKYPVREGVVALLEPFIDTVVICTMTGLVIVITQVYDTELYPQYADLVAKNRGAELTGQAFGEKIRWFPAVLACAATLFAYSTMISWSYYGERCFTYLFGERTSMIYRIIFLVFVFLGSVITATNVLEFSDLMILSMALPNMLGLILMSNHVKGLLNEYWANYKANKFPRYK